MAGSLVCGDHSFDFQQISIDLAFLHACIVGVGFIHFEKQKIASNLRPICIDRSIHNDIALQRLQRFVDALNVS